MNAQCAGNPCQGVTCNQPPSAVCLDATTLRSFGTAGVCANGACSYAPSDSTCAFGCANGRCVNDPCQGVTCNTPPAPSCTSSTSLRTFSASGSCSGGGCVYSATITTCAFGCANGACVNDPCQGVSCTTPPAAACLTSTILRTFAASGTCAGGACTYGNTDTTCAFGCAAGRCNSDPCAGVICNTPPARACVNGAARSYNAQGTCQGSGACSYGFVDTPCSNGCTAGVCNPPACGGTVCNAPPASVCLNATQLSRSYSVGSCVAGTCAYGAAVVTCSNGCINGACIAGSWTHELSGDTTVMDHLVLDQADHPVMAGCGTGTVLMRRRGDSGWVRETVDTSMGSSCRAQVALDQNQEPMIAYHDSVNGDLRFAFRNGGTWAPKELVSSQGFVGSGVRLAVDATRQPHVIFDVTSGSLTAGTAVRYATRLSGAWQEVTLPRFTQTAALKFSPGGVLWALGYEGSSFTRLLLAKKTATGWQVRDLNTELDVGDGLLRLNVQTLWFDDEAPVLRLDVNDPRRAQRDVIRNVDTGVENGGTAVNYGPVRDTGPWAFASTTSISRLRNGVFEDPALIPGTRLTSVLYFSGRQNRDTMYDDRGNEVRAPICVPRCSGRQCGDDGCGGTCGGCSSGSCSAQGTCTAFRYESVPGAATSSASLSFSPTEDLHVVHHAGTVPGFWAVRTGTSWSQPVAPQTGLPTPFLHVDDRLDFFAGQPMWLASGNLQLQSITRSATGFVITPVASVPDTVLFGVAGNVQHLVSCPSGTGSVTLRTNSGSGWSAAQPILAVTSARMTCRSLAFDAQNRAFVVLAHELGQQSSWRTLLLTNASGSWVSSDITTQVARPADGAPLVNPSLQIDGSGALVVYEPSRGALAVRAAGASTFTNDAVPTSTSSWYRGLTRDRQGAVVLPITRTNANGGVEVVLVKRAVGGGISQEVFPIGAAPGSIPNSAIAGFAYDAQNRPVVLVREGMASRVVTRP